MQKLSHYLLYLSLFLLPWQTHLILRAGSLNNSEWQYGLIALYGIDLLILLTFLATIFSKKRIVLTFNGIAYRYLLCAFLLFLIISIPFSLSSSLSLFRSSTIIAAILFIFALFITDAPFRKLSLAFITGAALSSLLGIWQFISQSAFASSWLGLASHDARELGTSVIEAAAPDGVIERWLRAYGSLDHPNMLGGYLAFALILASFLWLSRSLAQKKSEYLLIIASTVLIITGLILSFSRAAWIAAGLGLLIVAFAHLKSRARNWSEFGIWLACLVFISGLIFSQYSYLFKPRLSGDSRLENISTNERVEGYAGAWSQIRRHPLIGSGIGTYTLDAEKHSPLNRPAWYYQPAHNIFLLIISELGITGVLLLLGTIIAFFIHLYRLGTPTTLLSAFALAGLTLALLDHWLFSLHFGIILAGALFGLLGSYIGPSAQNGSESPVTAPGHPPLTE